MDASPSTRFRNAASFQNLGEAYKRWMKREERTDDITCIVAFIEAPPDAPRKTPKFEAPAPEGGGGSGPPQRRKSRRGSHSMDSFFGQVDYDQVTLHTAS